NPIIVPCKPGSFVFTADIVSKSDIFVSLTSSGGYYDSKGTVEVQFGITSGSNKIKNMVNANLSDPLFKRQTLTNIRIEVTGSTIKTYVNGKQVVLSGTN
ncbi:hypothetical protein BB560_004248, partial [Smittium megazygosporum]